MNNEKCITNCFYLLLHAEKCKESSLIMSSKTIEWINRTSEDKRLYRYLAIVLITFILSFFVFESSKISKSIYYVFFAIPTLFFFIFDKIERKPFKADYSFYFLLLYFLCGCFATVLSDNNTFDFFRYIVSIFALFYGLMLCTREQNFCKVTAICYTAICLFFIFLTFYYWQDIYFSTGISPRIKLYAAASNPVHASLLILTGWLCFWIIYGLPKLIEVGRGAYISGFILMQSVATFICVAFQSRSALLGLLAVTIAWLIIGRERQITLLLTLLLLLFFFIAGYHEPLLSRGTSYRPEIWQNVLQQLNINGSWLTGIRQEKGILYLGKFHHSHSAYMSILAQTGLVGVISFFIFTCVYFFQGIKKRSPWFIISLLGWTALLTTSSGIVDSPQPLWVYFWTPTLLAMLDYHNPLHTQNR